jgi:pimeloyl-ACP methyl ester carboxylesterase
MGSDGGGQREARVTRKVRAGQVTLQITESGEGIPLLLVHGFPLDHSMWDAQISRLSHCCHVIAPDLRGFGGSQISSGTVTMEQMADDLDALLDALEIEEPIVFCGLSMGGYVAFQFWRKYGTRLRGLVLCDTRAVGDTSEAAATRLNLAEQVLREGTRSAAETMLPRLFAPAAFQDRIAAIDIQRRTILATAPEGVAAALRGLAARPDVSDYLPQLALPTLVVVGQHDAISTVDEMRGLANAIPESEFVVIPGAGHMTPLENSTAFNDAIERFLTRLARPD